MVHQYSESTSAWRQETHLKCISKVLLRRRMAVKHNSWSDWWSLGTTIKLWLHGDFNVSEQLLIAYACFWTPKENRATPMLMDQTPARSPPHAVGGDHVGGTKLLRTNNQGPPWPSIVGRKDSSTERGWSWILIEHDQPLWTITLW